MTSAKTHAAMGRTKEQETSFIFRSCIRLNISVLCGLAAGAALVAAVDDSKIPGTSKKYSRV